MKSQKGFPIFDSVKYLGDKIDGNLSWKSHIDYISVKVSRANGLLFKIRNFVKSYVLRTIYFAIFELHLNYGCLAWSQNCNALNRLVILQKKLLELLTFSHVTLTLVLYSKEVLF